MSLLSKGLDHVKHLGRRRSFGLAELDRKLEQYLDYDSGFFVEAGANDGVTQSNTLYFERYRRWRGLLVEPVPQLAKRCRRNRPKAIVENVALVASDYERPTVDMRFCNLMSVVKGAMKTAEEEQTHIETGCHVQNVESYELSVPAMSLSDILDMHRVDQIDLLSLDVEGFEPAVIQGIDFRRHRPQWMLIEARYRDEIDALLLPLYEPVAELTHHDVLYRCKAA